MGGSLSGAWTTLGSFGHTTLGWFAHKLWSATISCVRVDIAGTVVEIHEEAAGSAGFASVRTWLAPFATEKPPEWRLICEERAHALAGVSEEYPNLGESVETAPRGLCLRSVACDVAWDLAAREARIQGSLRAGIARAILGVLALEQPPALPLHASAVGLGQGVHVFCGPSKSGKTTLAHALGGVLADDICLLLRDAQRWQVAGLPLWEGRPGRGPLTAIYFLEKGILDVRPVSLREALRSLLQEARLLLPRAEARTRGLELAAALLEECLPRRLTFGLQDVPSGVRWLCSREVP